MRLTVSSIQNYTGNTLNNNINSDLLRLYVSGINSPEEVENLNFTKIKFTAGRTITRVSNDLILPNNQQRRYITPTGNIVRYGARYPRPYFVLDLMEGRGLLSQLKGNINEPLPIKGYHFVEPGISYFDTYLIFDLSDTNYLANTGSLIIPPIDRELNTEDLLKQYLSQRYIDSLYGVALHLNLALSSSDKLNFKGKIEILNTLFKRLGYVDPDEYNLVFLKSETFADRKFIKDNTTNINPNKIPEFLERLNQSDSRLDTQDFEFEVFPSTPPNVTTGKLFILQNVKRQKGGLFVEFSNRGLQTIPGATLEINTRDYKKSFNVIVTQRLTRSYIGIAILPDNITADDLRENINNGSAYIIGQKTEQERKLKFVNANQVGLSIVDSFILSLVSRVILNPSAILLTLYEDIEGQQALTELTTPDGELAPPGITNSRRANISQGVPSGFTAITPIGKPYDFFKFCTKYNPPETCENQLNDVSDRNVRVDPLNRNFTATEDILRYGGELPLGVYPTPVNSGSSPYDSYWNMYQNGEPPGGCLDFLNQGRPDLVEACYAIRRCTRAIADRSKVFNCVQDTIRGLTVKN